MIQSGMIHAGIIQAWFLCVFRRRGWWMHPMEVFSMWRRLALYLNISTKR
jgi:hypothetical protein